MKENFMKRALEEAKKNIESKHGGPFGAVIVKDNKIIGKGHNNVILFNDPTAHAEIMAIRDACANIGNFNLNGAVLYTTCFPCPMCAGAILWSRINKIYYCLNAQDAQEIGFDDVLFYSKFYDKPFWADFAVCDSSEEQGCRNLFVRWKNRENQEIKY
ncbi:MAG: nucleoside deaminase [Fibromonadales bacterium]|nr:nucleoside deaminase [Fibromonadales bacterium]